MVVRQICKQVLFMRHLKKSVTDKVTLFYCYFDSEHPRCTWVVVNGDIDLYGLYIVLVPTMHVGCSSEICTKAVSLCSYFITMCCICQVLFPINFRFFILFFCSICFSSDFLVRIPLFHPLNRRENQEFRGTIFYYYLLKYYYF